MGRLLLVGIVKVLSTLIMVCIRILAVLVVIFVLALIVIAVILQALGELAIAASDALDWLVDVIRAQL